MPMYKGVHEQHAGARLVPSRAGAHAGVAAFKMVSLMCGIEKMTQMNLLTRQKDSQT